MSGVKVVPVEPTAEMMASGGIEIGARDEDSRAVWKAMIAAAPAVQGEPVAWMTHHDELMVFATARDASSYCDYDENPIPLYTAPQPVEQQPDDSASVRLDKQCREDVAAALGFIRGGNYAWSYLLQQIKDITSAAEQQTAPSAPTFHLGDHVRKTKGSQWKGRIVGTYSTSLTPEGYAVESDTEKGSVQIYPVGALELVGEDAAPDVDVLVEALEAIVRMDYSDHCLTNAVLVARAALAAHRKGGDTP